VKERYFMIVTARWLHELLGDSEHPSQDELDGKSDELRGLFSTGGPLVVAQKIDADVIVRAVRLFLYKEGCLEEQGMSVEDSGGRLVAVIVALAGGTGMSVEDSDRLQREIDEHLARSPETADLSIVLDQGSDVMDLSANVDVRVSHGDVKERYFMIVTACWLHKLLGDSEHPSQDELDGKPDERRGLYTTGGPLVVAREIDADVIVRGVRLFLAQEGSMEWKQQA
jgi:hypothetical protein